MDKTAIMQWLQEVQHPAQDDKTVVELGLVQEIDLSDGGIRVVLAFPKRPDPLKNYLAGAVQACLYRHAPGGTPITVETVVKEPVNKVITYGTAQAAAAPAASNPGRVLSQSEIDALIASMAN